MRKSVKISRGNSKLGGIPNVSLTPCATCNPAAPCRKDCYAMKAWRQYPGTRAAWGGNTDVARSSVAEFMYSVAVYLGRKRPAFFRWHVAGDIPSQKYLEGMKDLARMFPKTRFLAFTKRHNLNFRNTPKNLRFRFSFWPGWGNVKDARKVAGKVAFMQDGTEDRAKGARVCPGSCAACKVCWGATEAVQFHKH